MMVFFFKDSELTGFYKILKLITCFHHLALTEEWEFLISNPASVENFFDICKTSFGQMVALLGILSTVQIFSIFLFTKDLDFKLPDDLAKKF